VRQFAKHNGLSLFFLALFLAAIFGQALVGHADFNEDQDRTTAAASESRCVLPHAESPTR
jgi:putative copper export protein